MNHVEDTDANRRAAIRWGSFVVGLLSLQVLGGVFAIMLATGDESVAVVPNYHQKALKWDEEIAARNASDALGYQCDVMQLPSDGDASGLRLTVLDQDGEPLRCTGGELSFYHHSRAGDVRRLPVPAGQFSLVELKGCFEKPGLWQVSLDLQCEDGARFLHSEELRVQTKDSSL